MHVHIPGYDPLIPNILYAGGRAQGRFPSEALLGLTRARTTTEQALVDFLRTEVNLCDTLGKSHYERTIRALLKAQNDLRAALLAGSGGSQLLTSIDDYARFVHPESRDTLTVWQGRTPLELREELLELNNQTHRKDGTAIYRKIGRTSKGYGVFGPPISVTLITQGAELKNPLKVMSTSDAPQEGIVDLLNLVYSTFRVEGTLDLLPDRTQEHLEDVAIALLERRMEN